MEDSSILGVHEHVINTALSGKGRVSRVIPLGSRKEVLDAAKSDTALVGRPRLYVIDGDLEIMWSGSRSSLPHLYVLKVYEFENLLLELPALEDVICVSCPRQSRAAATRNVDVAGLIEEVDSKLGLYFVLLATAQRLKLHGAVFALNPPSVSRRSRGKFIGPDLAKVRQRSMLIAREIVNRVGLRKFKKEVSFVKRLVQKRSLTGLSYVPGKKFFLWYLGNRIQNTGGQNLPLSSTCATLAMAAKLNREKTYIRRLRSLI